MTEPVAAMARRLPLDAALAETRGTVDQTLTGAPALLRPYTSHLAGAHGKMLRALGLLIYAQDEGGTVPGDGVLFAAAVELLHLATLVHDDVIDDADTRRGIPTLQRKCGRRAAVICGDYLLSAALRMAASAEDKERYLKLELPDYMGRVCAGELLQEQNNRNLDLSVGRYLRIIRGKTAALFEGAYYAGAVLCTDVPGRMHAYARLGRYVGMIFQLLDDCIDYEADEVLAKKPVQSDYEQGVITLPLIHALAGDSGLKARAAARELGRGEVARAVRSSGGVAYTRWFAGRYYDRAKTTLDGLDLGQNKREQLTHLLDRAYGGLCPMRPSAVNA